MRDGANGTGANGTGRVAKPKKTAPFTRNTVDYSKRSDNNPTFLLEREHERLNQIDDVDALKAEMTKIMESSDVSRKNLLKFYKARDEITALTKMQFYLYNFILAGSAMQARFE